MKSKLDLRWSLVCGLAVFLAIPAAALDAGRRISQYGHAAWRIRDGAFSGVPVAITQTTDGYLWLGTPEGLLRYDGAQFVAWTAPNGESLPRSDVHALLGGRDGSLWIGTGRGLARWKNGQLFNYPDTGDWVTRIIEARDGTVWIARSQINDGQGPLCRITETAAQCYGASDGVSLDSASWLIEDHDGNLWLGGYRGLCRWKPGSGKTYFASELEKSRVLIGVEALVAQKDGGLWAGIERSGSRLEVQRLVRDEWKGTVVPGLSGSESDISTMFVDRDGTLWIGTGDRGIFRLRDDAVDHFGSADGLSSDAVATFFQDREGTLWVGTSKGIDSFRDLRVASFSMREGLTADSVSTVVARRDGTVWVGNSGAVDILRDGEFSAIRERHGLPGRNVTTMMEDRQGRMWAGVDGGLAIYDGKKFRAVPGRDGAAVGTVFALAEDREGYVWALAGRKLLRMQSLRGEARVLEEIRSPQITAAFVLTGDPGGGIWLGLINGDMLRMRNGQTETFAAPPSRNSPQIRTMFIDSDGTLLAATLQGLVLWKDGVRKLLTVREGLPCDEIYALVKDGSGTIWLYTKCGLVTIADAELKKWWQQGARVATQQTLDVFDGAQPSLTPLQPQAAKSADGRLWFANDISLQMVDPRNMAGNAMAPPVHIEGVVADGKMYSAEDGLRLPPLTRELQIDYAALSYPAPKKVRYRYMLQGHDRSWQEPENRRQAFYSDLRPAKYEFRVMACNNDGIWNEAGAALSFEVLPTFYQTNWFRALCILVVAAMGWALYLLRVRQMTWQIRNQLEVRLGERERIARELHDTLLQSIQGLILRFQAAAEKIPKSEPSRLMMENALDRADQVMVEGRERVRDLRTSGERSQNLPKALYEVGQEFAQDGAAQFRVVVEGATRDLHPVVREEIYWIAHEALANAFQHANAEHIEVEMAYDPRELRLRFRDDGRGIAPEILQAGGRAGHWGMPGMRERAHKIGAKIAMWSRAEAGTEVELRIAGSVAYSGKQGPLLRRWLSRWLRDGLRGGVQ